MAKSYYPFTVKSRLDKSINSLIGIVEGISIDGLVNDKELGFLASWINDHQAEHERHPYNEILPILVRSLKDGILDENERADIMYVCENLRSTSFYDQTAADLQRLHTVLAGIAADNLITETELIGLSDWLSEHEHLRKCWPYDEIDSLIISTLADRRIDEHEQKMLKDFFSEFAHVSTDEKPSGFTLPGVCAVSPEIIFQDHSFCFTGESQRMSRDELSETVISRGGRIVSGVSKKLNFLVVGSSGNPCWKYACYGRKIEQAVGLRKEGAPITLVHENDFFDVIAE
jgi:hypothetical protein